MASIAKILDGRAQNMIQLVAKNPQMAPRGAKKNVAVITLIRPKALNALCNGLMTELSNTLDAYEKDANIAAIVITSSDKAFVAGADINEMQSNTYSHWILGNFLDDWTSVARYQKPIIAAVNGYAMGGGWTILK